MMFVAEMHVQFVEFQDRNEVVSTGIVIAILSISALSFGWSRSLSDLGDPQKLGPRVHYAGEGLFIAALLALIALFFIWIKLTTSIATPLIGHLVFGFHWLFLLMAMIYAMKSVWELFKVAMVERDDEREIR